MSDSKFARTIQLGDEKGEYVNTIHIPPFLVTPDVIIWKKRIFYKYTSEVYREAFTWNVLENGPEGSATSPQARREADSQELD